MKGRSQVNRKPAEDCRPFVAGAYQGEIHPDYDNPDFIQAIAQPEKLLSSPDATILFDKRNRLGVISLPLSGGGKKEIVVKEFSCRGIDRLKSLVLPSKGFRAWRGALALTNRGLATAPPVAFLEKRKAEFVHRAFFLTERVEGALEIRKHFRCLSSADLAPLLASLAGYLSLCHGRGILHRDLSDGNILVKKDENGAYLFYLLDTNRIRTRYNIGRLQRIKSLVRLGVPPALQRDFLQFYFGKKPLPKTSWLWYKICKSAYAGYVGLKRRLRLRQLARRLRIQ